MKDEVIKDINLKISELEYMSRNMQQLLLDLQCRIDNGQADIIQNKEKIKQLINLKNKLENIT